MTRGLTEDGELVHNRNLPDVILRDVTEGGADKQRDDNVFLIHGFGVFVEFGRIRITPTNHKSPPVSIK